MWFNIRAWSKKLFLSILTWNRFQKVIFKPRDFTGFCRDMLMIMTTLCFVGFDLPSRSILLSCDFFFPSPTMISQIHKTEGRFENDFSFLFCNKRQHCNQDRKWNTKPKISKCPIISCRKRKTLPFSFVDFMRLLSKNEMNRHVRDYPLKDRDKEATS